MVDLKRLKYFDMELIKHFPLFYNSLEGKNTSRQSEHSLCSLSEALAACFGFMNPSSVSCHFLALQYLLLVLH